MKEDCSCKIPFTGFSPIHPRGLMVAFALTTISAHAVALQVNLNPVADTFVVAALPTNNFGGSGALSVAAPGLPDGEFQSLLRFDASTAKASLDALYGVNGWFIQSITLILTAAAPNNPMFNISSAGSFSAEWLDNDSWVEGTGSPMAPSMSGLTFSALPSFLGPNDEAIGTYSYEGSTSGTHSYSLDLSPALEADLAAGNLVSFRIVSADAKVSYLFNSQNFGTVANWPVLSITANPNEVPTVSGQGLVLVSGIVVLAGSLIIRHRLRTAWGRDGWTSQGLS